MLKFSFSKKNLKICFDINENTSKPMGDFFQMLLPFHNVLTYVSIIPFFFFWFLVTFGDQVAKILWDLCLHFARQDGQDGKICLIAYEFSTWKFQAQNMGRTWGEHVVNTNCFLFLFWHSEQFMYVLTQHVPAAPYPVRPARPWPYLDFEK